MLKKILVLMLILSLMGCKNTKDVFKTDEQKAKVEIFEVNDYLNRTEHDHQGYSVGYIFEIKEDLILVVSESLTNDYTLGANYLRFDEVEKLEYRVGQKVKYKTDGFVLTTYPGFAVLKELSDVVSEFDSISSREKVVQKIKETFEDIFEIDDGMFFCVNDLVLSNSTWQAKIVLDQVGEEKLQDFVVYIDDETLEVIKIEHYKVQ